VECPACHAENEARAKFCVECGVPLAARCPACGAEHRPGQRFCGECGAALAAGAPPATADPAAAPVAAPAELRTVSVLFVDLVGYTSLSEARDAEDVRELLSRYFETARTIVARYGGVVEKFIGDAVMAVWGTPVAREDDAERAVRAGLELVSAVGLFGAEVGADELRARAGVVTGQVASTASPGEGLVVGDRVNTASRVQSVAAPGTLLVDEVTRQVTSGSIVYSDAGEHAVKGKAEPLHLWRAERPAGAQRSDGIEAPFVGRQAELRMLKDLFHTTVDRGTARLVAVTGAAGVGKSRLRREFEDYLDGLADTVLWHSGRCLAYGDGVAYWALAEMVRQRLGIAEDEPLDAAALKLDEGLERWVPDSDERAYLAPRLGTLLGLAEPGLGREELFGGWRVFFERLADEYPVVLAFEDLQWADEGLLDFLEHLLEWSAQRPVFVLAFARPELSERREGWAAGRRGVVSVYLEPLGAASMRELLYALVQGLPDQARDRIVEQAEGVPLYALETVRALVDRGVLAEREGALALVGELGELDVPASLSSLLAARLDGLDPDERELVKAMAVFGGSFPRSAAEALSELEPERLDAVLASLVRKEVLAIRSDRLSPERGQYVFAQALLRTVAYEMLSRRERGPRHLAAAEHLRATFPNDGEEVAEVVAAHYLDAYRAAGEDGADELRAQALAALGRAAQRAATIGAPAAAERAYRSAIGLAGDDAERAELGVAAGRMAYSAGRFETAVELLDDAAELHRASGRPREAARLERYVGQALWGLGRTEEATRRLREALEVLGPEHLDPDVAAISAELGRALLFGGHLDEAGPHLETALTMGEALRLPDVLSSALTSKGVLYVFRVRPEEARGLMSVAVAVAERHGLEDERLRALANVGNECMMWDLPEAAPTLEETLVGVRRLGQAAFECLTTGNLMYVQTLRGQWDEAEALGRDVLARATGGIEFLHERLVHLHVLRGALPAARESLAAIEGWRDIEVLDRSQAYATASGMVSALAGDPAAGLQALRAALAEAAQDTEKVRIAWPVAMGLALDLGRIDDAAELLALVDEMPPGHRPPYVEAQRERMHALVAAAQGDEDGVETGLRRAADAFRRMGYPYWRAVTQTDLAGWLIGAGRRDDAAPLLQEAVATLMPLRALPALGRANELLSAVPGAVAAT
jgi:class 3 adenylate cyclase/tetratricopeptide (TPR) repeat protein